VSRQFSVEHQRLAGRKRARAFTKQERSLGGKRTATQHRNALHCQVIAPEGFLAWSVQTMRGKTGLRLLKAEQIHFLRLEDMAGKDGARLCDRERRLQFGLYVWVATFDGLVWPTLPDDGEFLAEVARVQSVVGRGLSLPCPLDALYCAPNDFCDPAGVPWSKRKQRKLFRDALRTARTEAIRIAPMQASAKGSQLSLSAPPPAPSVLALPAPARKPGLRRSMNQSRPQYQGLMRPAIRYRYDRPDLPWYDWENITPTRPYRAAPSADSTAWYAASCPLSDDRYEA